MANQELALCLAASSQNDHSAEAEREVASIARLAIIFRDFETLCRLGRVYKDRGDAEYKAEQGGEFTYREILDKHLPAYQHYHAFPKVIGALSSIGQSSRSDANGNVSNRVAFTNSIGMKFSRIESGKFTMGTESGRRAGTAPPQNEIAHEVELSRPFFIATCEVVSHCRLEQMELE